MPELNCPVCGTASAFEQSCREADLYRCPQCDHCFSDPASLSTVEDYAPEYFDQRHKNWFEHPNLSLFDTLGRIIAKHNQKASVLDLGCGRGDFLRHLRRKYPELSLVGLDISSQDLQDGIQFVQGDVLSLEFPRQFDVVVSLAVIEHMIDVQAFMKRLYLCTAPGGLVIVSTINDRSALYAAARLLKRVHFQKPIDQLYSRHHLNHFNTQSLRRLLNASGLSVRNTVLHDIPMAAVDVDSRSPVQSLFLRLGAWGTFLLGRVTGRTYLQTVICEKPVHDTSLARERAPAIHSAKPAL